MVLCEAGVVLLFDVDGVGEGNGDEGLGWDGGSELEEPADGI